MIADLAEARPTVLEGTSAMVRMRSGTCEVDVALTDDVIAELRALVTTCLNLWGLPDLDFRVVLAASELLTNAYQHARPEGADSVPVKLLVSRTPDGVFLSVRDPDPCHPIPVNARDTEESGRGLALLKAVSNGLGCSSTEGGKDVWVSVLRSTSEATK